MIAGYVKWEELKIITGFSNFALRSLLSRGVKEHKIHMHYGGKDYTEVLYNLAEVEEYIKIWL